MITSVASSMSRADLLQRANDFKNEFKAEKTFPYPAPVLEENDFFTQSLKDAKGSNLGEIKANTEAFAAAEAKKAKIASLAGLGLMIGGFVAPLPPTLQLVKTGALVGGFVLNMFVAGKASREAANATRFADQLGGWEKSLNAAASQQPAPAPAPTQPAPASQPAAA